MELIHASVLGDLDRVRQLLDRGTDPNIQDEAARLRSQPQNVVRRLFQ